MAKEGLFSIPISHKKQTSMQSRFAIFSLGLFLLIVIPGSTAFVFLMERIRLDNAGMELAITVEIEQLKLEASVTREIAIVLKMADSPLLVRYFNNPDNRELEEIVFEEFTAYQKAINAESVFWVNDKDKILYTDSVFTYIVDPSDPENYWYPMTLYETKVYNFNINYNHELNETNLWINAPVFDNDKPIGIVGAGINLSEFVDEIYRGFPEAIEMYLFNVSGEITGARDINLIAKKVHIEEKLSWVNMETIAETKPQPQTFDETGYFHTVDLNEVAVFAAIPSLNWYMIAVQKIDIIDSLMNGMTILFAVMMLVILLVFLVFNKFVASLFKPLNRMTGTMYKIIREWDLETDSGDYQKDEIGTLNEFLDVTIKMMSQKLHAERIAHELELDKGRAEAARQVMVSGFEYARRIQKNLLIFERRFSRAFTDYFCIWEPKDIVSGDLYWIKNFSGGTVLCVFDCTGHGTPGALLTMLVFSAFEAIVNESNCMDTAQIIWELEKQLVTVLNVDYPEGREEKSMDIKDGCDLAVLYIAKDGSVTISAGNTHVFVCDGIAVNRIKGQRIHIGNGILKSKEEIRIVSIPANPANKFYIGSDGLYEQVGGSDKIPFGYTILQDTILKYHGESLKEISGRIWQVFEEYRGENERRDDFELISFKC